MCGLAGRIGYNSPLTVDRNFLSGMGAFLKERGPDFEGYYIHNNIGLAHTRLSIIDLSEAGNQPMTHFGITIVFNGEVYNYKTLRHELEEEGASFKSHSDTEVIIVGYTHWGLSGLLERIDGMFAFALFDKRIDQVFLVRDPFGKKPLYYFSDDTEFLFSSDIRSIWSVARNKLTINSDAMDYYFAELTSHQPSTIWREIFQVKPGHFISINTRHPSKTETRYFFLEEQDYTGITEKEALELTEKLLTRSIVKRTVADVEVGCFLSGGIDSGLVTSILAANSSEPVKSFTVGFEIDEFNEIPQAHQVVDRYQTDHEDIVLKPIEISEIVDLMEYYGEPFADSSAIPTFMISKAIGKHVKVALSGDGGDESFGGYPQYLLAYKAENFQQRYPSDLIQKIVTPIDKGLSRVIPKSDNYGSLKEYNDWPGSKRLLRDIGFNTEERRLILKSFSNYSQSYLEEVWSAQSRYNPVKQLLRASFETRLLNDYLVKVDRASMKNSLEVRSPFLDKELVSMAINLPENLLFKHNQSKYLLKRLAQKYISMDVMKRPKMGFGIPLAHWLRNEYRELIDEYLRDEKFRNRSFFNIDVVNRILDEHQSLKANHGNKIWSLICFEIWCRKFLD
ncbi:MAG: asparagine synthase (glutamine-hydrolyzing) [Ekhidna sp.]